MATEIRSESCLWVGERLTDTASLPPSQREALAVWLKKEYLNELCRGRISFEPKSPEEKEPLTG